MFGPRLGRMVPVMVNLGGQAGWVGFVKGLPGCGSAGTTPEECEDRLADEFVGRIEAEEAQAAGGRAALEH